MKMVDDAPQSHVDAFNALLAAGSVLFERVTAGNMTPEQLAELRQQITVDGYRVRMILEEGLCIIQLYRDDHVHELVRSRGSLPAAVN